jgi:hypothetical protein
MADDGATQDATQDAPALMHQRLPSLVMSPMTSSVDMLHLASQSSTKSAANGVASAMPRAALPPPSAAAATRSVSVTPPVAAVPLASPPRQNQMKHATVMVAAGARTPATPTATGASTPTTRAGSAPHQRRLTKRDLNSLAYITNNAPVPRSILKRRMLQKPQAAGDTVRQQKPTSLTPSRYVRFGGVEVISIPPRRSLMLSMQSSTLDSVDNDDDDPAPMGADENAAPPRTALAIGGAPRQASNPGRALGQHIVNANVIPPGQSVPGQQNTVQLPPQAPTTAQHGVAVGWGRPPPLIDEDDDGALPTPVLQPVLQDANPDDDVLEVPSADEVSDDDVSPAIANVPAAVDAFARRQQLQARRAIDASSAALADLDDMTPEVDQAERLLTPMPTTDFNAFNGSLPQPLPMRSQQPPAHTAPIPPVAPRVADWTIPVAPRQPPPPPVATQVKPPAAPPPIVDSLPALETTSAEAFRISPPSAPQPQLPPPKRSAAAADVSDDVVMLSPFSAMLPATATAVAPPPLQACIPSPQFDTASGSSSSLRGSLRVGHAGVPPAIAATEAAAAGTPSGTPTPQPVRRTPVSDSNALISPAANVIASEENSSDIDLLAPGGVHRWLQSSAVLSRDRPATVTTDDAGTEEELLPLPRQTAITPHQPLITSMSASLTSPRLPVPPTGFDSRVKFSGGSTSSSLASSNSDDDSDDGVAEKEHGPTANVDKRDSDDDDDVPLVRLLSKRLSEAPSEGPRETGTAADGVDSESQFAPPLAQSGLKVPSVSTQGSLTAAPAAAPVAASQWPQPAPTAAAIDALWATALASEESLLPADNNRSQHQPTSSQAINGAATLSSTPPLSLGAWQRAEQAAVGGSDEAQSDGLSAQIPQPVADSSPSRESSPPLSPPQRKKAHAPEPVTFTLRTEEATDVTLRSVRPARCALCGLGPHFGGDEGVMPSPLLPLRVAQEGGSQTDPSTGDTLLATIIVELAGHGEDNSSTVDFTAGKHHESEPAFVHAECALWSPEVYTASQGPRDERIVLRRVAEAIDRGSHIKCAGCRRTGATLGCVVAICQRSFHYPCAAALASQGELQQHAKPLAESAGIVNRIPVVLDAESLVLRCDHHSRPRSNSHSGTTHESGVPTGAADPDSSVALVDQSALTASPAAAHKQSKRGSGSRRRERPSGAASGAQRRRRQPSPTHR